MRTWIDISRQITEQEAKLKEAGYEVEPSDDGKRCMLISQEVHLMTWEVVPVAAAAPADAVEVE